MRQGNLPCDADPTDPRASMRSSQLLLLAAAGLLIASVSSLTVPGSTPAEQRPEQCTKFVTDLEQCLQTLSKGHQALKACTNHQIRCADGLQIPLDWLTWLGLSGLAIVVLIFSTLHFRGKYNQQRGINKRLLVKLSSHERSLIASSAETCQFATDLLAAKLDQGSGSASQPLQQNGPVSVTAATPAAARGTPAPATPTSAAPAASPTAAAAATQQLTPGTPSNTPVAGGGLSPAQMGPDGSHYVTKKDLENALLRVENKHLEKELLIRDLVLAKSPASAGRSPPGSIQATPAAPHVGMVRGGYGMPSPLAGVATSNSPGFSSSPGGFGGFGRGSPLMPPSAAAAAAGAGPGSVGSPAGSFRGRPSPQQPPSAPGSAASAAGGGAAAAAAAAAASRSRLGNTGSGAGAALGRDFQSELEAASANGGSPAAVHATQPPMHAQAAWSPAPSTSPAGGPPAAYGKMGPVPASGTSAGGGSSPGMYMPGKASSPAQPFMPVMPQRQGSGAPTSSPPPPPMGMPPAAAGAGAGSPPMFPAPPRHPAV